MKAARFDVAVGTVPDYATFVRHIWGYREEDGLRAIGEPPWMYSVLFEDVDEVAIILTLIETVVAAPGTCGKPMLDPSRIEIAIRKGATADLRPDVYEVRFADLQAVHVFMLMLAAQASVDAVARQAGEFLMWTLGFRWV